MSKTIHEKTGVSQTRVKNYFMYLSIFCTMLLSTLLFSPKAEAITPAGTTIGNIATATYEDSTGNPYTTNSLQVNTVVQPVYGFDVDKDGTKVTPNALVTQQATPGSIIYYQYKITNNGNVNDNFTIDNTGVLNKFLGTPGFTPTIDPPTVYWDKNGTGNFQTGDPILTTSTQLPIAAGAFEYIIVEVKVPAGATAGSSYENNIVVRSVGDSTARDNNEDMVVDGGGQYAKGQWNKTTVINDAVVDVDKATNVSQQDPSGLITYTLTVKNNGNKDSQGVTIRDPLPNFVAYDMASASLPVNWSIDYCTATTGDASGNASTNAAYGAYTPVATPATTTVDTNIKGVRFRTTTAIIPGASVSITFRVKVKPYGLANQTGSQLAPVTTVVNTAKFDYELFVAGTPVTDKPTNDAPTDINKKLAVAVEPNAAQFAAPNNHTSLGGTSATASNVTPGDGVATVAGQVAANSYVYFRQTVTNNGNSTDTFNLTAHTSPALLPDGTTAPALPTGWSVSFFQETDTTNAANNTSPVVGNNTGNIAPGGTFNYIARVFVPANAATTTQNIYVKSTSTSVTGTALGTTFTLLANDYSLLRITDVTQPGGKIENIVGAATAGGALQVSRAGNPDVSLTESANGTTVSFPLRVTNTGLVNDTFTLGIGATNTLPSGWTAEYYDLVASDKVTAVTATTVTLNNATNFAVGDTIIINGQSLTVGSKAGNVITFATGQTVSNLTAYAATITGTNFPTAVKPGNITIVSTGNLAANGTKDVIAVITVPVGTAPITKNLDYKITSANAPTSTNALLTVTDAVIVPNFRSFTLTSNNAGSGPAGGVLFYTHILTNTGNVTESFNLAAVSTVVPSDGFTYVIQDYTVFNSNGSIATGPISGLVPAGITLTQGQYLNFKLKVNIPANASPGTTIDTADLSATETTSSEVKINTDTTSVVTGFLTVVKTGKTFSKSDPAFQTTGAFDYVKAATVSAVGLTEKAGTTGANLAAPGDVIEYTITYSNGPSADALKTKLKDLIPDNTLFLDGNTTLATLGTGGNTGTNTSLKMGATYATATASTSLTNATTDDNAEYVVPAAPGKPYVLFYVGTSPSPATGVGGTVAKNTSGVVIFRVIVK